MIAKKVNIDGKSYDTSSKEYSDIYNRGISYGKTKEGALITNKSFLPSVSVTASKPKSFSDFINRVANEASKNTKDPIDMITTPVSTVLGLPQAAMTYLLDKNKNIRPSKALDIQGLKGIATDIALDPMNIPYGSGAKFLTNGLRRDASSLLKNNIIPKVKSLYYNKAIQTFKPNPDAYYRVIGDEPGYLDAIDSKIIRPNQDGIFKDRQTYYTKGAINDANNPVIGGGAKKNTAYKGNYIVEVLPNKLHFPNPAKGLNPEWNFGSTIPGNEIPINSEFVKFYKRFGKQYKQIEIPKNNFNSEINWDKWNREIPKNKALMKEYNTIEQSSKANGTWMKNPDGSVFKGTPEQFIQQRSENFKKAFGDSKLINPDGSPTIQYHGSAKKFNTFDESKFQLGDTGYSGKGIYTTPSKTMANSYATSSARFHSGEINPTVYELYGQANNPISSSQLIKEGTGKDLFNFHRNKNWEGELTPEESLMQYDAAIADQLQNVKRIRPWNDARELVFPSNKQLKSAIGNNGMFDMKNPNIYKTVATGLSLQGINKLNE